MEIQLTLNGRSRKEAANCIGEVLGVEPLYKRAPSYAYEIGGMVIDLHGVLSIADGSEHLQPVLEGLQKAAFCAVEDETPILPEQPERLVIQLPLADFTDAALDNLRKLVASKAALIRKAIGTDALPIEPNGEMLDFAWFPANAMPEETAAYAQFIAALCGMAKRQQRVLAVEKPVENEKYAFRCFLLRLGLIGEEYAFARKLLLKNLVGNGSMKSGERKPVPKAVPPQDQLGTKDAPAEVSPAPKPRFSLKKLFGTLKTLAMLVE